MLRPAAARAPSARPSQTAGIVVHFVNDPPVIDLDSDNSAASGSAYAAVFIEDGNPVAIADTDAVLSDIDSTTFESLTPTTRGQGSSPRTTTAS